MRAVIGRPWLRRMGLIAGLLLVAAALAAVWARRDLVAAALGAVAAPSPGALLLLAAAIVANLVLSGLMFSVLMARHGRVGLLEMQALIVATALVNYLPLRAGLFGRIAYHQAVNGIGPRASAGVVVQAVGLSVAAALYLAAALVVAGAGVPLPALVAAPVPILGAAALRGPWRVWALAAILRYLDIVAWALRYHAAFVLLGSPIDAGAAVALGCIGTIATMVPFFSNGLGLREWAVGLAAPLLTAVPLELGLTAELINRAAELAVTVPLGVVAVVVLAARMRKGDDVGTGGMGNRRLPMG